MKKLTKVLAVLAATALMLTGCGSGDYSGYSSAYNRVTAQGGMEANLDVALKLNGESLNSNGNFKLDTSSGKTILYYDMQIGSDKLTQFSDGSFIYTESGAQKTKYAINTRPSASAEKESAKSADTTFDSTAFLSEFSSFLEAGKIKELGFLSPIEKSAISKISKSGNEYTLEFSDGLIKKFINIMIQNETGKGAGDTISIDELNNFVYKATETDGVITKVNYQGVMVVSVPASLMASGQAETYDLDFDITINFVNPGSSVDIALPSTDGFEEVR